ncbi:PorT family protein [Dysgonomonas sp. Marseille-P4677]|uniref:porin family protein n=1 Tax=Dysgonomonas sp. Marseille-P4677 TaxID=2364790 RepID=UPI001912B58E|nr:porin family protein [Dysgonomonas sp. Marseille-P4677]MBK5719701.1 PorT family protein [Dysgonomonas sp. Marseille-P4677]
MMKKQIFLLLIAAFCVTFLNAQKKKFEPEWTVGVGFGPTFSSVDFQRPVPSERLRTKSSQQYFGGISIKYISEKNLGFIAELNYSQQGWEQFFQDHPEYEHSHQLNYLELPILTHIYFGNKVRFIINLGPKVGFLISDSEKMNNALFEHLGSGDLPANEVTHQYYRMADKKIDYGIMGGLGLEFKTGIGSFALEGRYYFGLGDIYNNKKSDYFSRSANRVISAKLTYYVKLF